MSKFEIAMRALQTANILIQEGNGSLVEKVIATALEDIALEERRESTILRRRRADELYLKGMITSDELSRIREA